jgi:hypothetical protein
MNKHAWQSRLEAGHCPLQQFPQDQALVGMVLGCLAAFSKLQIRLAIARWQGKQDLGFYVPIRHACRESVVQAPWQAEAENNRQEVMQAVLAAPRPFEQKDGGQGGGDGGPAGMDVVQHGDAAMAVDGQAE